MIMASELPLDKMLVEAACMVQLFFAGSRGRDQFDFMMAEENRVGYNCMWYCGHSRRKCLIPVRQNRE